MTSFRRRMLAGWAFIIVIFVGLVGYAVRVAPRMERDSTAALNEFYRLSQAHDYKAAHSRLGRTLRAGISEDLLRKKWGEFEAKHGKLKTWKTADLSIKGFGGSVCVFPPFVDFRYAVSGSKGTGTLIYARMIPEDSVWRLERFSFLQGNDF